MSPLVDLISFPHFPNDPIPTYDANKDENNHNFCVLPPHRALQLGALLLELERLLVERVRLVDKKLHLFTALKNLFCSFGKKL